MAKPVIIVGGGLVGLGTAWALTKRGIPVLVLEKEDGWAAHQSGHNSGVVHSGLYYAPGSLKAKLALAAVEQLEDFCLRNDVGFRRPGKMIVAVRDDELPRMRALLERGRANGVPVSEISLAEAHDREPHVRGVGALWVASTAVVDFPAMAEALAGLLGEAGAELRLSTEVTGIRHFGDGVSVGIGTGEWLQGRALVNCAGLQSDRVLALEQGRKVGDIQIVPFRGEYYSLVPEREYLVSGLVYPVPDPDLPFLGVHLTRTIHGDVHVGPNAVLALRREGYRWRDVSTRDLLRTLTFPGTWRVAAKHGGYGLGEAARSLVPSLFLRSVRQMLPEVEPDDLVRSGAGVRAQAVLRDGTLCSDFVLRRNGPVLHVLNAPSPAATASLQIGERITEELLQDS